MVGADDNDTYGASKQRRTKDAEGRNHKCNFCSKTYLSYPALYTHLKNKHAKGPDGNPVATLTVGRGRGRPKKSLLGYPGVSGSIYRSQVEAASSHFFKSIDKQGGPIFPDIGFQDIYSEIYIKKEENKEDDSCSDGNENTLPNEGTKKSELEGIGLANYPSMNNDQQYDANGELIKKKRGRKPKSFYVQKILEE